MKNDGGRAFPVPENVGSYGAYPIYEQGMSLRDWFAGQALSGLITYRGLDQALTEDAYRVADAMLAERAKP